MEQYKKILGKVMMTAEGTYNKDKKYEPISLVTDEETNKSYISRKEVPAGTQINNREYWQPVASSGIIDNGVIILNRKNSDGQIPIYDLKSATEAVSANDRKGGVILGFLGFNPETDTVPTWKLYQYNDVSPSNWTNIDYWLPMDYTNKYAGWFDNEEALYDSVPFPKVGMYAYVGNSASNALVYRCYNDKVWQPTEDKAFSGVVNLADEEDITSKQNKLKFKDKEYNPAQFSGLGKFYLRKNIVDGKNILTQSMIEATNTIYVIQYDYNLNGAQITINSNSVLRFEGGSIINGTIILNDNCKILGKTNTVFNANIIVKGKNVTISNVNIETSEVCIYGEHPYDVSNLEINGCNLVSTKNNCIKIVTDTLDGVVENINIRNSNMKFFRMGIELQNHGNDNVRFIGGTITNCKFSLLDTSSYNYGYAISLSGRGNNINITDCLFDKCYMGIELVGFNYTIISNNKMINGIGDYLIAATNVRRMTGTLISNNTFDGQELFITNTDRGNIVDNIFTNNRGITFTAGNRCIFKNNHCVFRANATTAVMLDNSYNCRIEDNYLDISASTNFFSVMRAYGSNSKYNVFRSNFIAKPEGGNVFDQINEASNNYCYDYYFINDGSHSSTEINSLNNNITSSVNSLKNSLLHKVSESFSSLPIGTCCLVYGVNSAGKVSNPKLIIRKATALNNNKIDINLKFMFRDGNNQHYANLRLVDSSYSLKNPYVEKSGSMSSITYAKTTDGDYTVYTITFSGSYEDAIVQGFAYCSSGHNISWCS